MPTMVHPWREVLEFWFPDGLGDSLGTFKQQVMWWMRDDGAHHEICSRFSKLTDRAAAGELDSWAETSLARLALIVVLDQFSRSVYRDTPRAAETPTETRGQRPARSLSC